jgi:host factor-I protein
VNHDVPPEWRREIQEVFYSSVPAAACGEVEHIVYNACMSFQGQQQGNNHQKRGRTPPPEDTYEEASFLKSIGEKQKPVSVKLMDGQTVHGWIEYFDKNMVRLTREGAPNLFIFKHEIMYIAEEGGKKK